MEYSNRTFKDSLDGSWLRQTRMATHLSNASAFTLIRDGAQATTELVDFPHNSFESELKEAREEERERHSDRGRRALRHSFE